LREEGYAVDHAPDGDQATMLAHVNDYDVILLDLMLPKKNGLLVADAIGALADKPRLIVLSGLSRYLTDRFPAGTLVLQKPYEIDKLAEVVRGLM